MSQFWHANWAENAFKPTMLGNWLVPNWHPEWPCIRHCVTSTFLADRSGRLLPDQPRSKQSPWGDFKGTWDLPLKIDRKLANSLSAPRRYKIAAWQIHKKHYEGPCASGPKSPKRNMTRKKASNGEAKNATSVPRPETTKPRKAIPEKGIPKSTSANNSRRADERKQPVEAKRKSQRPKDNKKVPDESANRDEEGLERVKEIAENGKREQEIHVQKPVVIEEKIKDQRADVAKKESEEFETMKCLCKKKSESEKIPKSRRKICAIHQRLRV